MQSPLNPLLIEDKLTVPQRHSAMASCTVSLYGQGSGPTLTHMVGPEKYFMNCLLRATTLRTVLGDRGNKDN